MAGKCTVCGHRKINKINEELINGTPYRTIAKQYGVGKASLQRHFKKHLPAELLKAHRGQELIRAENLNKEVGILRAKIYKLISASESRLVDPENSDLYSLQPGGQDITNIMVDEDGKRKFELNREKPARLLIEAIRRAERLVELQINLDVVDRLAKIEEFIERG